MWISVFIQFSIAVWALLKLANWYIRRTWGSVDIANEISAKGKIVLITGASSGVGKQTALEFATRDAVVILACRDLNKANATVKWIRTKTSMGDLVCMRLDLSSLQMVRSFCKEFQSKYDRLDILVNNAGLVIPQNEKMKTVDGFEIHMGVHHLGHFLLTNLLLDQLKKAAPSRIINVASKGHSWSTLDLDDILSEKEKNRPEKSNDLYCRSKMANVLFNKELADKLKGTGVNSYGLCPGLVYTDIGSNMKGFEKFMLTLSGPFLKYLAKSVEQGASTTMYCALSKSLTKVTGEMYQNCGYWDPKDRAVIREEDAKKLWEQSVKLVSL